MLPYLEVVVGSVTMIRSNSRSYLLLVVKIRCDVMHVFVYM